MPDVPWAGRARLRRHPERGSTDPALIHAILDEGLVAHVAFAAAGQPYVIPMAYGRDGDRLVLHGSSVSRLMTTLATGLEACVAVTLLDGLVLARSTFAHSMNYRSVICFGQARPLTDDVEKRRALDILVEHLVPHRTRDARAPDRTELDATAVLEFTIEEASAKVRSGPPRDAARDLHLDIWSGVIPLRLAAGSPQPAHGPTAGPEAPGYVAEYTRQEGHHDGSQVPDR